MEAPLNTSFDLKFPGQKAHYRGKVREVYTLENGLIVLLASDRISAFDVVLPKGIPHKGQVLNQTAAYFLEQTADVVPNWFLGAPHPVLSVGKAAVPFKIEMVVRGHLSGHAWRTYSSGLRSLCGEILPEGLLRNQAFARPIITPTTKADDGAHDQDVSASEIVGRGIVSAQDYAQLEAYSLALFAKGREMARDRGLILVDTKYEFGKLPDGKIILIDEVHTPDSSRYFELEGFEEMVEQGLEPIQLSKEFVREWLMSEGFQGREGDAIPHMSDERVQMISNRYVALYERITGQKFEAVASNDPPEQRVQAVNDFIGKLDFSAHF